MGRKWSKLPLSLVKIHIFSLSLLFIINILMPDPNNLVSIKASPLLKPFSETTRQVKYLTRSSLLAIEPGLKWFSPKSPFKSVNIINAYYQIVNPNLGGFYSRNNGHIPSYISQPEKDDLLSITRDSLYLSKQTEKNSFRTIAYTTSLLLINLALNHKEDAEVVTRELAPIYGNLDQVIEKLGQDQIHDYAAGNFMAAFMLLQTKLFTDEDFCDAQLSKHRFVLDPLKQLKDKNLLIKESLKNNNSYVSRAIEKFNALQLKCKDK